MIFASRSVLLCTAAGLVLTATSLHAKFAMFGERVPAQRLIENVSGYVREHPNDAQAHYTLGRLYSIAYTGVKEGIYVVLKDRERNEPLPLPAFGPWESVRVERTEPERRLSEEQRQHLTQSLRHYRRATQLEPKEALYWLGLGWMSEQAVKFGLKSTPEKRPVSWRAQALAAYRRAYALRWKQEAEQESHPRHGDAVISVEAGEGVIRLLAGKRPNSAEARELSRVRAHLAVMSKKPMWVTPILIGRSGGKLADLLSTRATVKFDLNGSGQKDLWPWVKPGVGLLVWDPLRTGRITSGRQLFGSRTWAMFWRNGYEPLAALDDDRNGRLQGLELLGVSIWYDQDGDGRSQPGEVVTADQAGILALAVRPTVRTEGVPAAMNGVRMRSGAVLPTFDWTPRSIARLPAKVR